MQKKTLLFLKDNLSFNKNNFVVKNFQHFNPPKALCNHLIGKEHSAGHRMIVGVIIMYAGVLISKVGEGIILHLLTDGIGYFIHAVGSIPFIEKFEKLITDVNKNTESNG